MCRLNIIAQRKNDVPITYENILEFVLLNRDNYVNNDDGEGLVCINKDRDLYISKSLDSLSLTEASTLLNNNYVIMMNHTRRATTPINEKSIQPFIERVNGKELTFMHNGVMSLKGFNRVVTKTKKNSKNKTNKHTNTYITEENGFSDSYYFFSKLVDYLRISNDIIDALEKVFENVYLSGSFSIFITYGLDMYYIKNLSTSMNMYIADNIIGLSTSENYEKVTKSNFVKKYLESDTLYWFKYRNNAGKGALQYTMFTKEMSIRNEYVNKFNYDYDSYGLYNNNKTTFTNYGYTRYGM